LALLERAVFWPGYLVVSLKGYGLARLLNLTVKNDIYFWDLSYCGSMVTMKIRPRDFKRMRPLLRRTGCRAYIKQKRGALFLLLQGRRRKGLALGIVLFCFMLYFLSLFVWSINIDGNEKISSEQILAVLEEYGVERGILKREVDLQGLERELLLQFEGLSWAGASLSGAYLDIQVVERLKEPAPEKESLDLVASRDGLVVDVLVLAGEAAVEPGETVYKGQLLIAGIAREREYFNGDYEETVTRVQARGMVESLVWYESYAEAPLYEVIKNRTGRVARSFALKLGEKEYFLGGVRSSPYHNYELEIIKRFASWRNIRFPVELIYNNYWQLEVEIMPLSPWKALQEARSRALQEVNAMIPRGAVVKKRFVDDYYFTELGTVGCRVMVETLEDIAVPEYSFTTR